VNKNIVPAIQWYAGNNISKSDINPDIASEKSVGLKGCTL
jgi:hypothetical protein